MTESWRTRSGQSGEGQVPEAGDDLAAVQRQLASSKRGRASLEEEASRKEAERKARLEHRSTRQRALEPLADRRLWAGAAVVAVAALFILLALPAIRSALNPPMSRQELASRSSQLQLSADSALGASSSRAPVKETPENFILTYRVPAGSKRFRGGKTTSSCSLTLIVSRQSQQIVSRRQLGCKQ